MVDHGIHHRRVRFAYHKRRSPGCRLQRTHDSACARQETVLYRKNGVGVCCDEFCPGKDVSKTDS
jgi:hypothetical protein